jgi:hypothetical protein
MPTDSAAISNVVVLEHASQECLVLDLVLGELAEELTDRRFGGTVGGHRVERVAIHLDLIRLAEDVNDLFACSHG